MAALGSGEGAGSRGLGNECSLSSMVAGRGHSPPQSGLDYFRKCSSYLFLCLRCVPGGRRWPVRPRDERGGKQRFGGGWPRGGPGSIWGRGVDRGCVGRFPRGVRAFSSQAPVLSGPGPEHPRSWPRGVDSRLASFSIPSREPTSERPVCWPHLCPLQGQSPSL